jgi:NADPH-dependent 2,4-dienoyl-CoA reductase/sulfur reductase-like enzyme
VPGQRIVVVGGSLAGLRAAQELRRSGFTGEVVLLAAEPHFPPYDRPPLSKRLLAGDCDPESVRLRVDPELPLTVHTDRAAIALDTAAREVVCADGERLSYDGLVIGTGAHARSLPVDPAVADRVLTLRTIDDGLRLRAEVADRQHVAILGAGFVGCEVAATLRSQGKAVTVIDLLPAPMIRALGPAMGDVVAGLHERHGVTLRLGRPVTGIADDDGDVLVSLGSDAPVRADLLVVAVGAAPATDWLRDSGLDVSDGVLCDEFGFATTDGTVVAAGDVARWHDPLLGRAVRDEHWTNAVGQAQTAARNLLARLADGTPEPYRTLPYFWSDQYDWKLQLVGRSTDTVRIETGSVEEGKFVAGYVEDDRLVGALCVNLPAKLVHWRRAIGAAQGADRV